MWEPLEQSYDRMNSRNPPKAEHTLGYLRNTTQGQIIVNFSDKPVDKLTDIELDMLNGMGEI